MALPTSGQISLSAIANNKDSASLSNLSLSTLSAQFASGSSVGDVDGNSTANQTADRSQLNSAPFAISEFRGAEFVNAFFDTVVAQLADGTVVTSNGYVDGESGRISFRVVDDSLGPNYSAGLKRASDNAVLVTQAASISGTGTKTISITAPSIDAATDAYYPFVTTGTFENAQGSNIDHFDAIGSVTITDPSDTTVANNSATTNIEHQISITDDSSFNDINWTFAKSSGPGSVGTSTLTNSSDRSPTVSYTGVGIFTIDCRVDGTPSQARNSSTAAQVTHRIDFSKAITINNPSSLNEGGTITATGNHQGFSSGIDVDLIQASDNTVLLQNDDTTDSRQSVTAYNKTFTAPARTDSTLSVKVKAFDGGTEAESNAFNIYPLISQQFDANDLSFGASSVKVNTNITLDVANDVTDNIVGYQWSNEGSGNMTVVSGNASAGDTDGSSDDSVSIIDLTDQSHPTVRFDTAEQNKTIRLRLYGRINQDTGDSNSAEKTINVELANSISSVGVDDTTINSGQSFTISATVAGVQSKTLRIGYGTANNNTTYDGDSADKTISDARFSADTQNQPFTRNLTSGTSLETFFPKANITDGTIGVSAGSSFQVAPAFSYNTPGDVTINVNETRALDISSIVGHNVNVVITSSPDKGSGTNTATLSPGTLNGIYTISYDGDASFGQTSDTSDEITVNPTVSVAKSAATGTPTADTDGVSISSTSHGLTPTTFTFTPTAVGTSLGFTYSMASGFSFTSGNANTAGAIQGTFNSAGSKSNSLQVASNSTSATDGFSVTMDSITKDFNSASTDTQNDGLRVGATVTVATNVDFVKRARLERQLSDGSFEAITGTTTISHGGQSNGSGNTNFSINSNATVDTVARALKIVDVDRTANEIALPNNITSNSNFVMNAPEPSVNSFSVTANAIAGRIDISYSVSNVKTTSGAVVIKRATNSGMSSGLTTILSTTTTSQTFAHTGLANATTFHFRLEASNASGETALSSVLNATTANPTISRSPTGTNTDTQYDSDVVGTVHHSEVITVTSQERNSTNVRMITTSTNDGSFRFKITTNGVDPTTTASGLTTVTDSTSAQTFDLADANTIKIRFFRLMDSESAGNLDLGISFRNQNGNIPTGGNTIRFTLSTPSGGGGDPGGDGDLKCIDVTMMLNMKNGMMYVDDVSIGDMVRTYNMETKTDEYVEIEDIIKGPHYVYNVGLEDETEILITDSHPIIAENDNLLSIIPNEKLGSTKLNLGDKIMTTNGLRKIVSISEVGQDSDTYTVITKNKNFYADGVLIHDGRIRG